MIIWYRIVGVLFLAICLFVAGHQINEELRLLRFEGEIIDKYIDTFGSDSYVFVLQNGSEIVRLSVDIQVYYTYEIGDIYCRVREE